MAQEVRDLALEIYDTIVDPLTWTSVLDQLVDRMGVQVNTTLEWFQDDGDLSLTGPFHSDFYTSTVQNTYIVKCQHLEAKDREILREQTLGHDEIELLGNTPLAPSVKELKGQENVQKQMHLGIFYHAAGMLNKENSWIFLFSVQLNANREPPDHVECEYLVQLLPRIEKALDLSFPMRQLNERYQGLLPAIDCLNIGVCVLDVRGMIVARNQEFQRQLETFRTFRVSPDGESHITDRLGQEFLENQMSDLFQHGEIGARQRKESIVSCGSLFEFLAVGPVSTFIQSVVLFLISIPVAVGVSGARGNTILIIQNLPALVACTTSFWVTVMVANCGRTNYLLRGRGISFNRS